MIRRLINQILALTLLAWGVVTLAPMAALAQTSLPPVTTAAAANQVFAGGELEKVTVTGYLIPRVGGGPQPVFTMDQDFISKQADQTINDLLNRYPGGLSNQNALTFTGNSSSPASSAFGLRGLPAGDTLVLIDGYRFPDYPIPLVGVFNFVDLNSIPLAGSTALRS